MGADHSTIQGLLICVYVCLKGFVLCVYSFYECLVFECVKKLERYII